MRYMINGDIQLSATLGKMLSEQDSVLLYEAFCCHFPGLSFSGTARWLWEKNRTPTGLDMAVSMTVIGMNMKVGWRAASGACGNLGM